MSSQPFALKKYNHSRYSWRVWHTTDGERLYKVFVTKREAEEWVRLKEIELNEHGSILSDLTNEERSAVIAFRAIEGGKALGELVKEYAAVVEAKSISLTIEECIGRFRDELERGNLNIGKLKGGELSVATLQSYKSKLKVFADEFKGWSMSDFDEDVIREFFQELTKQEQVKGKPRGVFKKTSEPSAPHTKNSILQRVKILFDYAVHIGACVSNPAQSIKKFKTKAEEVKFYTAAEAAAVLDHTPLRHKAAVAISLFAGVRVKELQRLTWGDVKMRAGNIVLSPTITKTKKRRVIPIQGNLMNILSPLIKSEGYLIQSPQTWRTDKAYAHKEAAVDMIPNGGRKSFITHRVMLTDQWKTATEAGNSPDVIEEFYKGLTDAEESKLYFTVGAAEADNITTLKKA